MYFNKYVLFLLKKEQLSLSLLKYIVKSFAPIDGLYFKKC